MRDKKITPSRPKQAKRRFEVIAIYSIHRLQLYNFFRLRQCAESDTLRHSLTMLAPQMTINTHGQRAAVTVSKPFAHGWNINARLNAKRGE